MGSLYSKLMRKPDYQQDVQRRRSAMPWQQAVPNTRGITQHHVSGMAEENLEGQRHAANIELGQKRLGLGERRLGIEGQRLAMGERTHADEMGLKREGLGIAKKQGRVATGLGVANVGLQGLAGILQIRNANEKVRLINEMQQHYLDSGDMDNYWNARFAGYL